METYEWQKNRAIVDRMYYTERVAETTTFFALSFMACNQFYVSKGYFADIARARMIPTLKWWFLLTIPTCLMLQWPLTKEERYLQMRKRWVIGKFVYSTWQLDRDDNTPAHPADLLEKVVEEKTS